jgi:hypothetical protein
MSGSLTIKFDTISQERRDIYAAAMIGILETIMKGADEVNITYASETPVMRGKHKTTKTTKWEVGQDAPTFEEIGIYNTQHDMFETVRGDHRTFTAPIGSGLPDHATAVAEAEEDARAADEDEPEVEQLATPPDDQPPTPTVEETREALSAWAYLLDEPTDQDAEQSDEQAEEADQLPDDRHSVIGDDDEQDDAQQDDAAASE